MDEAGRYRGQQGDIGGSRGIQEQKRGIGGSREV